MLKISPIHLKKFFQITSIITDRSHIQPITRYVRLSAKDGIVTLTKTNLEVFAIHDVDDAKFKKEFVILIDSDILAEAANSPADEITISFKEQKANTESGTVKILTISDGLLLNLVDQCGDETKYPAIPKTAKDEVVYNLTPDMVSSLVLGVHCIKRDSSEESFDSFLWIRPLSKKSSYICGFNRSFMYYKTFKADLPEICLHRGVSKALAPYIKLGATLSKAENYDLFNVGSTIFGFIKKDLKGPDYSTVIGQMDNSKTFTVRREDIMQFCATAKRINAMSTIDPLTYKNGEAEKSLLIRFDNGNGRKNEALLEVSKNKRFSIPEFIFHVDDMIAVLSPLSTEMVTMTAYGLSKANVFITTDEDPDYTGAIMAIAPKEPAVAPSEK